ncbi:MAG: tRNA (guanosine(37)-N1)-methyltransferase TrmD [Oscillospiraceae bacterium]|nr:tRNA (guanosine(37)-N1)-methyltransferase TrmD [Oscillospiraceae bacterium]
MRFDIMTLFPDMVNTVLSESVIGRAQFAGILDIKTHNIRGYSKDKHRRVDDTPYGGGKGMIISPPAVCDCYYAIDKLNRTRTIYMSPQGQVLTQKKAAELKNNYDQLIILCGHYEGIDYRIIEEIIDEEISIGDYILTGGEMAACVLVDCVGRLVDGVLTDSECHEKESIACGMLEYPQYTKPAVYNGRAVPDVLRDGNHAKIELWRIKAALDLTRKKRPDLL